MAPTWHEGLSGLSLLGPCAYWALVSGREYKGAVIRPIGWHEGCKPFPLIEATKFSIFFHVGLMHLYFFKGDVARREASN